MYKLTDFIKITEVNSSNALILDTIGICKRKANTQRDFLFVNRVQGKHIPVRPQDTLAVYKELCALANAQFKSERIAVVGFSETATAIGHYMAAQLNACIYSTRTTREVYEGVKPLIEFLEEHSHAPSQLLYGDLQKLMACERIVFVEDEITTGKTILNFINAFNKFKIPFKYGVISILNWQSEKDAALFLELEIPTVCLLRGEIIKTSVDMETVNVSEHRIKVPHNLLEQDRFGVKDPLKYNQQCYQLGERVLSAVNLKLNQMDRILVLGTEEFMYIPLQIASCIESSKSVEVVFHATTRSPILPCKTNEEYAIKNVESLVSPYADRETFIYNLQKYDQVIVITDAADKKGMFKESMVKALTQYGNTHIVFIWLMDQE